MSYMDANYLGQNQKCHKVGTITEVHERISGPRYVVSMQLANGRRKVLVSDYRNEHSCFEPGDVIVVSGELKLPEPSRNPGCFDYRKYLICRHISYICSADHIEIVRQSRNPILRVMRFAYDGKVRFLRCFDQDTRKFVNGALFGDKGLIDDEVYEEFAANGTAHILSVSGLHVGFLIALMEGIARKRKGIRLTVIVIAVLIIYGVITYWSAATIRAIIIAVIAMLAMYIRCPFDLTTALSASLIITLLTSPYQIYNSGYIMSYLAVFGAAFLKRPIERLAGTENGSLLAIQIATIPYVCAAYNHWNPISIIINMPIVLIASILIPIYIIGYVIYMWLGTCPELYIYAAEAVTNSEVGLNHFLYMNGVTDINVCTRVLLTLVIYVTVFYFTSEFSQVLAIRCEHRLAFRILVMLLIPVLIYTYGIRNEFSDDEIVFIDVGQGDAIHLRCNNTDVLFDGGGSDNYNIGRNVLKPYLLKNNTSDIDMLLLTHMHMDHAKASSELEKEYPVKSRVISCYYKGTEDARPDDIIAKAGDVFTISDKVSIKVLWPVMGKVSYDSITDENEFNAIFMINYGEIRILITGDILEQDELDMVEYYAGTDELKCDVLKVAHHGSSSSTSDRFLDAANPAIAVIQVGENNRYGHPSPETVNKLNKRGIKVYRTDQCGAIGLDLHKKNIIVDRMIDNVI